MARLTDADRDRQTITFDYDYITRAIVNGPRDYQGRPTVHAIVRSVAKSGMSRVIDLYTVDADGDLVRVTPLAAALGIGTWARGRDGIRVQGGGMDMAWHTVYRLSAALEDAGVLDTPADAPHTGYALTQRTL